MAGPMVIDLRKSIRSTYDADDDWLAGRRRRGGALGSWKDWRAWNAANPGKPKDSRGRWTDSPMDQQAQRGGLFKVDEGIYIHPDRPGFRNEYGHFISDLQTPEERTEELRQLAIDDRDLLDADLDRGTRGAFIRFYTRPVQSVGYDQEPGRFGRGRLQVSGKGAMIIDLVKTFGGLTPDLTKRKRGGTWTAADEAKINRDGRGRFAEKRDQMVGILGAIDSEQRRDATRQMDEFLRGLVQETGGGNTKLGRALMEIVGPGEHVAAKPTGPKADPGKPLTATGRGKQVTPETLREIGEIRARPMPGDRDRLNELFMGMTVAQMGHVAGLHGSTMQPAGDKKQKANQLVETMIGRRLNSDKIRFGSWNERDDATGTRIQAINRQMKETTDREEYGRLHIEREALSNGGNVADRPKPKPAEPSVPDPGKPLTATGARIKKEELEAAHAEVDEIEAKAEPTGNDAARLKDILSRMTVPQIKEAGKRHGLTVFPGRTKAEHIQSVADMIVGEKIKHRRIAEMVDETDFYGDKRRDRKQTAQQLAELPIESASLDRARALIGGMTAGELRALAKEIGPTVNAKGTKRELVESIVEGTVGFRLKAKTMNPDGWGRGDSPERGTGYEGLNEALAGDKPSWLADEAGPDAPKPTYRHATRNLPDDLVYDIERDVRAAHLAAVSQPGRNEYSFFSEWRAPLDAKYGRANVDAVIVDLGSGGSPDSGFYIIGETNQKTLTPERRAGAVRMGNQDNHLLSLRTSQNPAEPKLVPVAQGPSAKPSRSSGMTPNMESVLTTIDDEGGLEMKKADFQTEYGLTDREMRRLINEGLIETDDRAGPGYIGLTDAGQAALRAIRG